MAVGEGVEGEVWESGVLWAGVETWSGLALVEGVEWGMMVGRGYPVLCAGQVLLVLVWGYHKLPPLLS